MDDDRREEEKLDAETMLKLKQVELEAEQFDAPVKAKMLKGIITAAIFLVNFLLMAVAAWIKSR